MRLNFEKLIHSGNFNFQIYIRLDSSGPQVFGEFFAVMCAMGIM